MPHFRYGVFTLLLAVAAEPAHSLEKPALAELPAGFVANNGQFAEPVAYTSATPIGTLFVERSGDLTYAVSLGEDTQHGWAFTERFEHRASAADIEPGEQRAAVNYLVGDQDRWRRDVPVYGRVDLGDVWPGINVELISHGANVEKRFTLRPGATVSRISMVMQGLQEKLPLSVADDGKLVARTGIGVVEFTAPVAWQTIGRTRQPVEVRYRVEGNRYGFELGPFDPDLPVVIDPLIASTHLGASGGAPRHVAIDRVGDAVFVAGTGASTDFPVTPGVIDEIPKPAFIARFSGDLTTLEAATFFGGSEFEMIEALHYRGDTTEVLIAGRTSSEDLPGTAGGAQAAFSDPGSGETDGFVAALNRDLSIINQATYLGGADCDADPAASEEEVTDLAVHPTSGDIYVTGITCAVDFPGVTGGAYEVQTAPSGEVAFVARLSSDLQILRQSTYYGDTVGGMESNAIAIHPGNGDVYIGGFKARDLPDTDGGFQPVATTTEAPIFIARFEPDLTQLDNATYYFGTVPAGPRGFAGLQLADMLVGVSGDVFVTGIAHTSDPPGLSAGGAQSVYGGGDTDAYVARLNPALTNVVAATLYGGEKYEFPEAMAQHPSTLEVVIVGGTASVMLPGVAGAIDTFQGQGAQADGFAASFNPALTVLNQATYIGGNANDYAHGVAAGPFIIVTGESNSTNFPGTAAGEFQTGAGFVSLFDGLGGTPAPVADLNVFMSDDVDPVEAGGTVTYTVTAQNTGPDNATGVVVTYPLPTGVTFLSADPICALVASTVECTVGNLAGPTSFVEFDIVVAMPTGFAGVIESRVFISGNETDPDSLDDQYLQQTTVTPSGLEITDSIIPADDLSLPFGEIRIGQSSIATVTVRNQSGTSSTDVRLTEFLMFPFVFDDPNTCDVTLGPGESCTLTIRYTPTEVGTINENFTLSAGGVDTTINLSGTAIAAIADLSIDISTDNDVVVPGASGSDLATITVAVTNLGPDTADIVEVSSLLSADLALTTAAAADQGNYDETTGVWAVGALGASSTATLSLPVQAASGAAGCVMQSAEATIPATAFATDPDAGNNAASIALAAEGVGGPPPGCADLGITVLAAEDIDPSTGCMDIDMTIRVRNRGPGEAKSLTLEYLGGTTVLAGVQIPLEVEVFGEFEEDNCEDNDFTFNPQPTTLVDIAAGGTADVTYTIPKLETEGDDLQVNYHYRVTADGISDPDLGNNEIASGFPIVRIGPTSSGGGDCFIATAAYGSYMEPEVLVLRQFRDEVLLSNAPGREIVDWYYRTSPRYAAVIAGNETARLVARVLLTPLVYAIAYPWFAVSLLSALLLLLRYRRRISNRQAPQVSSG